MVLLSVIASRRLEDSRVGRAWVAIREDEIAAASPASRSASSSCWPFTLSAAFRGPGGAASSRYWERFVTPESFVFWESILVVSIVVLGGMGSISGVLLGALILSGSPPLMQAMLSADWINYRYLFFGPHLGARDSVSAAGPAALRAPRGGARPMTALQNAPGPARGPRPRPALRAASRPSTRSTSTVHEGRSSA